MSVIPETSQDPIGPCGPLAQSAAEICRHSKMAASNSSEDLGAHPVISSVMGCDNGPTLGVNTDDIAQAKHKRQGQGRVIQGELASVSQLMFGANGGCTCRGDRANGGCTCIGKCTREQADVFVVLSVIVTVVR